jgi:hypothetical protein
MSRRHPTPFFLAASICSAAALLYFNSTPQVPIAASTTSPKSPSSRAIEPVPNGSVQSNDTPVPTAYSDSLPLTASKPAVSIPNDGSYRPIRRVDSSTRVATHSATTAVTGGPFSQPPKAPAQLDDEIEISVSSSAQLPVALLQRSDGTDSATELSPAQQKLADKLAEDFVQEVVTTGARNEAGSANPGESNAEALNRWQHAAAGADERFRSLFGYDIYNREIVRQHQVNKQTLPRN